MNWSGDFAYAIGLITTDGCLSKDGRHIDFTSKDLEQISNFKRIVKPGAKVSTKRSGMGIVYPRVQFSDVRLYKFLLSIGLHPNKSKTLKEILVPDKYFIDFLRGCFDGDGYSHSYWDKRWKSSFLLYMGFVSASKDHLEWIKQKIFDLYGIHGALKRAGKSTYQLKYAKTSSIMLFNEMYYSDQLICLHRKKFKIQAALDIIDSQAGVEKLEYSLP